MLPYINEKQNKQEFFFSSSKFGQKSNKRLSQSLHKYVQLLATNHLGVSNKTLLRNTKYPKEVYPTVLLVKLK